VSLLFRRAVGVLVGVLVLIGFVGCGGGVSSMGGLVIVLDFVGWGGLNLVWGGGGIVCSPH